MTNFCRFFRLVIVLLCLCIKTKVQCLIITYGYGAQKIRKNKMKYFFVGILTMGNDGSNLKSTFASTYRSLPRASCYLHRKAMLILHKSIKNDAIKGSVRRYPPHKLIYLRIFVWQNDQFFFRTFNFSENLFFII